MSSAPGSGRERRAEFAGSVPPGRIHRPGETTSGRHRTNHRMRLPEPCDGYPTGSPGIFLAGRMGLCTEITWATPGRTDWKSVPLSFRPVFPDGLPIRPTLGCTGYFCADAKCLGWPDQPELASDRFSRGNRGLAPGGSPQDLIWTTHYAGVDYADSALLRRQHRQLQAAQGLDHRQHLDESLGAFETGHGEFQMIGSDAAVS